MRAVIQTITADHHLNQKQSATEQLRWPMLTPSEKPAQTEKVHDEETRPANNAAD